MNWKTQYNKGANSPQIIYRVKTILIKCTFFYIGKFSLKFICKSRRTTIAKTIKKVRIKWKKFIYLISRPIIKLYSI